VPVHNVL